MTSCDPLQVVKQAQDDIKRSLELLNNVLSTRTFLVGERVTLADITVTCNLLLAYKQVLKCDWLLYVKFSLAINYLAMYNTPETFYLVSR